MKVNQLDKVFFDVKRLRSIIQNLLDNAIKYNNINGKVDVTAKALDNLLSISVSDNGIGIPEQDQEKTFHKFHRAGNVATGQIVGSGLACML